MNRMIKFWTVFFGIVVCSLSFSIRVTAGYRTEDFITVVLMILIVAGILLMIPLSSENSDGDE